MTDDGRLLAFLATLGITGAAAVRSLPSSLFPLPSPPGSRGIARAGRRMASNLEPSDDPVDSWPDRYVVLVASDLSLVVAHGIPGARLAVGDMEKEKWHVASIDVDVEGFDEVCDRVFADIAQKQKRGIGSLVDTSSAVERDDSAENMLESDNHAVLRSLSRGISSIRIPDSLHDRYYRWYVLHPGSGNPSDPNNQRLADLLQGQPALPPGYTIPLQGGHGW